MEDDPSELTEESLRNEHSEEFFEEERSKEDEVTQQAAIKELTPDELIKNYVRTMHLPLVTNWRELSDSEGEEKEDKSDKEDTTITDINAATWDKKFERESSTFSKDKPGAIKPTERKTKSCLLNFHTYGTYYHMPYKEMPLRNTDQCSRCAPIGELGRCVCCGGASIVSPSCRLHKNHRKHRLVKEARVYHMIRAGAEFSEYNLLKWDSSERKITRLCDELDSFQN